MQEKTPMHQAMPMRRPQLLAEAQAARYVGMSCSFLRQSRMNGHRPRRTPGPAYLKIGRKVLYLREDLDAWLLEHRRDG